MFSGLLTLLKEENGATAIEYGLIAALIAVVAVTALTRPIHDAGGGGGPISL